MPFWTDFQTPAWKISSIEGEWSYSCPTYPCINVLSRGLANTSDVIIRFVSRDSRIDGHIRRMWTIWQKGDWSLCRSLCEQSHKPKRLLSTPDAYDFANGFIFLFGRSTPCWHLFSENPFIRASHTVSAACTVEVWWMTDRNLFMGWYSMVYLSNTFISQDHDGDDLLVF